MQYGILTFEEPKPDTSRQILHVDMDAFYASVEIRDNPSLRDKPVVIARHPKLTNGRGIVTTCNYEARKYGIHSAMSAHEAYKRCPHAIFIPGNMDYYRQVSQDIHQIFRNYTNLIEPVSLDEAYLDVSSNRDIKSSLKLAREIQARIKAELSLTCSIGISYNKFLAKLASDYHKPFGITMVAPNEALAFLKQLPISKFHGVGEKSLAHFEELGIKTGEDLYQQSLEFLVDRFGKMGYSLYFKVRGIHNAPVKASRQRKSVGKETTYATFLTTEESVRKNLHQLTHKVSDSLIAKNLQCFTLTLKIRYDNFETITRQVKLNKATNDGQIMMGYILNLWEEHGQLENDIRLLGVSASNIIDPSLHPSPIELNFFKG